MKFFVLLAFGVVFLTVFTRAEDEDEDEEEEDDEDDDDPTAMGSVMQLNNNNVGDIHNIKGKTSQFEMRTFQPWKNYF